MKISSVLVPCQFINCENKLNENEKGVKWLTHTHNCTNHVFMFDVNEIDDEYQQHKLFFYG